LLIARKMKTTYKSKYWHGILYPSTTKKKQIMYYIIQKAREASQLLTANYKLATISPDVGEIVRIHANTNKLNETERNASQKSTYNIQN